MDKACNQCDAVHPDTVEHFRPRSRNRGLEAICRACSRENARATMHHKRTSGYIREHQAKIKRIELVNKIKLERGCTDCGYKANVIALEFDHLPQYEMKARIADLFMIDEIMAEIAKCEVVCANCHKIRTAKRNQNTGRPVKPVDPRLLEKAQKLAKKRSFSL